MYNENYLYNIYLAGPIRQSILGTSILEYDISWRKYVKEQLKDTYNILNPIDMNESIRELIEKNGFESDIVQSTLFYNDTNLLDQSNILFANLLPFDEDNYPALGTLFEIGYCSKFAYIIIICNENSKLMYNPMYYECKKLHSIDDGINFLKEIYYDKQQCKLIYDYLRNNFI